MDHFQLWYLVSTLLIVTKLFSIPREAAEAKAAAEQSQAASSLPPEPAQNCGQSVANLRSVSYIKSMLQLKLYILILLFVEVFQVEVDENISVLYCLFRELSHYQCLSVCS